MTVGDVIDYLKQRKRATLVVSVLLHLLVLGTSMLTFSARSVVAPPEDLVPVDIISDDNSSKAKFGSMDGKKEAPKPLADKIGEKKPADKVIGKVDPKQTTETDSAPAPLPKPVEKKPDPPKPVEKPVEKKPDPPKPVVQNKPKPEEKKPDPFSPDQIANVLKKEEKPKPQQVAEAKQPEPPKHKSERKFDQEKISDLLNQKGPTRQAVTGSELNANAALGTSNGSADANVASWAIALQEAVGRCFNTPYTGPDDSQYTVDIDIQFRPDGTLAAPPTVVAAHGPQPSVRQSLADNAKRAVENCAPYPFLPKDKYAAWKLVPGTFNLAEMNSKRGRP